jgi:beta-fructofuranosidase
MKTRNVLLSKRFRVFDCYSNSMVATGFSLETRNGKLVLRLLMDRESIELFINDGERAVTSLIPTPMEADQITFAADAEIPVSVEAHHLK